MLVNSLWASFLMLQGAQRSRLGPEDHVGQHEYHREERS